MRLSLLGAKLIRIREGTRTAAYRDATGTLTIGCGFTWASNSFRKWWAENKPNQPFALGATMTLDQIDECMILMADEEYGKAVNDFLGHTVVGQNVFDAMVSMVWNCGEGSLKWQWAQHIKAGDLKSGCDFWRTTATKSKGVELKGLVTRRNDEANQALHGYPEAVPSPPVVVPAREETAPKPPIDAPIVPAQELPKPITYGTAPVPKIGWLDVILAAISTIIKGWKR